MCAPLRLSTSRKTDTDGSIALMLALAAQFRSERMFSVLGICVYFVVAFCCCFLWCTFLYGFILKWSNASQPLSPVEVHSMDMLQQGLFILLLRKCRHRLCNFYKMVIAFKACWKQRLFIYFTRHWAVMRHVLAKPAVLYLCNQSKFTCILIPSSYRMSTFSCCV